MRRATATLALLLLAGCGSDEIVATTVTETVVGAATTVRETLEVTTTQVVVTTQITMHTITATPTSADSASTSQSSTTDRVPVPAIAITCGNDAGVDKSSYKVSDFWDQEYDYCDAAISSADLTKDDLSKKEKNALSTAYGEDAHIESLETLYELCAEINPYLLTNGARSEAQVVEGLGMLMICPDHPRAREIEKALIKGETAVQDEKLRQQQLKDGTRIGSGTYLVNSEVQPGTWRTVDEKVEDCHWSLTSSDGTIMDNFIGAADQQTITIPAIASRFETSGCGEWIKVE